MVGLYNLSKKGRSSLIIIGVVMIKKPINSNFDHSNRFLTDYIPQNFAFTYAYVASPGA